LGIAKGPCEFESLENYQKQVDAIREYWKEFKESMKDFKRWWWN
jgi:hypothetical protein